AFQTLKQKLTEAPILIAPNWDLPFELMYDANDFAIVIEFGDSYKAPTNSDPVDSTRKDAEQSGRTVTVTTDDMQKKKNDVKAMTTLLLSLPDEHQLRFSKYKTTKELWAAILKTFGEHPEVRKEEGKKAIDKDLKLKKKSSKALIDIDGMGWDWSYMENEEDHALKNIDSLNSKIKELKSELSKSNNHWYSYKLGVAQLKERLNEYKEREEKYIVKIRTLKMYRASNLDSIKILTNEVETLKEEKDVVDGKLARLLKSSKDLKNIIESQRSDKVKEGLGYNDVPPSAADLYLSPKKDLSWTGLPEFVDDTVTDYSRRRVQRDTNRSQNHSYKSPSHRSDGHRPNGALMRPPLRSSGPRPHGGSMRPSFRPTGH
nr:reverse transcriptase domain-containing protein [Tanacetum cinerariifolium]